MQPYKISNLQKTETEITAQLSWDKDHAIFLGHFPGRPIVPGALMLDIISKVISQAFDNEYYLKGAKRIKFLNTIQPQKNTTVQLHIKYSHEEQSIKANTVLKDENMIFLKFNGNFAQFKAADHQ